jgi:ABC-type Fe3+/spermidine/putrescine transport system ATPase subunit
LSRSGDDSFISIQSVSKRFGDVKAVEGVSIDIRRGEFFSLLGPSGCGKTTLLRMLAGFEFPTSGEIFIDGQPMAAVAANHRPVGMVFQSYAIFPHLSVRQNIGYSLRRERLSRAQFDARVGEMLELIKLPGYERRRAHELSGGERQRVALARSLIRRPKVLLLDEPLGALDKQLRERMQIELRQLQRALGTTFVFVTHDQEEALALSDRIAVMSKGHCLQVDTPSQLYESPRSRRVAEFIGTMNFFDGRVSRVAGSTAEIDAGPLGALNVPVNGSDVAPGAAVLAALRPERLTVSGTRPGDRRAVGAVLDAASYLGDRSHLHVRVEGLERSVIVSAPSRRRDWMPAGSGASEVWLSWDDEAVVLLDPGR